MRLRHGLIEAADRATFCEKAARLSKIQRTLRAAVAGESHEQARKFDATPGRNFGPTLH